MRPKGIGRRGIKSDLSVGFCLDAYVGNLLHYTQQPDTGGTEMSKLQSVYRELRQFMPVCDARVAAAAIVEKAEEILAAKSKAAS